jgi:hypothetical protein
MSELSEDVVFDRLRRPSFYEIKELIRDFTDGRLTIITPDEWELFFESHLWSWEEYINCHNNRGAL